tara:strand:- start:353 stop:556 length:204 start_codon:yes stop_codon:yes gene_type:complete
MRIIRSTEKRERKPGWGADSDILGGFSHRDHGGDTEVTEAVRQGRGFNHRFTLIRVVVRQDGENEKE